MVNRIIKFRTCDQLEELWLELIFSQKGQRSSLYGSKVSECLAMLPHFIDTH